MKQNVSEHDFVQAFDDCNRSENFSREGRQALYDHLTAWEQETGIEFELDPIAVCCEYSEYGSADEAASPYFEYDGMTYDDEDGGELKTPEEVEDEALEFLRDRTTVILFDGGVIVGDF